MQQEPLATQSPFFCRHSITGVYRYWSEVKWSEVAQLCPTLCDPMDCSPPGSLVHGIFQARILEWMWELEHKEGWAPKNWCLWTVVLKKTLEIPLDCKEIKSVSPKGNQSWIFIRRPDAEAEAPILCPPNGESQVIRKDPDAGKDWKQKENGTTKDGMVRRYSWLSADEFEQASGDGEGQGNLACCSPWGHKELDTIEQLNIKLSLHK